MPSKINWSFAELCESARTVGEVQNVFMHEIRELGFSHAACSSHVDPLNPPRGAVMMLDYPRSWVERYSERGYARCDPVFWAAHHQALPFQWSDLKFRKGLNRDQLDILNEGREAGLLDGFTIPIHGPRARPASCSLIIGPDGVDPLRVRDAHWYAVYAYERARGLLLKISPPPQPRLSVRERQCVELFARGKKDPEIGIILGLSEHTVHNVVRRVLEKFGVSSRIQAFVRALRDREIALEDIAD